jgi:hypothetical protein
MRGGRFQGISIGLPWHRDSLAVCSRRTARSLPDLKEIGCKSTWPVHISPLFWSIETIDLQNRQNLSSASRIFASIL